MITRKLHFSYLPKSARIRVQVCKLDDVQRTSKLLSSTDGIIAIEVHRPADKETKRAWVTEAEHHFQSAIVMPWNSHEASAIAVNIWNGLGRPDVGALVFARELTLTLWLGEWSLENPTVLDAKGESHVFDPPIAT